MVSLMSLFFPDGGANSLEKQCIVGGVCYPYNHMNDHDIRWHGITRP